MLGGICESPLTIRALLDWRDKIETGEVLLRDVIDLDATFGGAGTDGDMPDDINSDAMINAGEDRSEADDEDENDDEDRRR